MKKKTRFFGILIVLILIVVAAVNWSLITSFFDWRPTYAQYLVHKLAQGDTTSMECGKLADAFNDKNASAQLVGFVGVFTPQLEDYAYLYGKHRCLGSTTIALFSDFKNGHTDTLIDLATGERIMSCTVDYSHTSLDELSCSDVYGNVWTSKDGLGDYDTVKTTHSPFPIYSGVLLPLQASQ